MKITRERKIYVAAAGVGLAALAGDQLLFAEAAPTVSEQPAVTAGAAGSAPALSVSELKALIEPLEPASDRSLAARMRRVGRARGIEGDHVGRDPFVVPEGWITQAAAPEPAAQSTARPDNFADSHQLMGVMPNARVACAVVDGNPVMVGQSVDGYTLEKVLVRSVLFSKGSRRVELHLDEAPVIVNETDSVASVETE